MCLAPTRPGDQSSAPPKKKKKGKKEMIHTAAWINLEYTMLSIKLKNPVTLYDYMILFI
jgi:hypothetical protein